MSSTSVSCFARASRYGTRSAGSNFCAPNQLPCTATRPTGTTFGRSLAATARMSCALEARSLARTRTLVFTSNRLRNFLGPPPATRSPPPNTTKPGRRDQDRGLGSLQPLRYVTALSRQRPISGHLLVLQTGALSSLYGTQKFEPAERVPYREA